MSSSMNYKWIVFPAVLCTAAIGMTASAPAQEQGNGQYDQPDGNQADRATEQDRRSQADDQRGQNQYQEDSRSYDQGSYNQGEGRQGFSEEDRRFDSRSTDNRSQGGQDQPAGLGVSVIDTERGVRVRDVSRNSPAEMAGIRPGDEILAINDRRIQSGEQLVQVVREEDPGTEAEIRINRNGSEQVLRADLETRREALNFDDRRMQDSQRFYRGEAPPWGGDEVRQHVDALERQVRQMQREVEDLRAMLENDPSGRPFTGTNARRSDEQFRDQRNRDGRFQNDSQFQNDSNRNAQSRDRDEEFGNEQFRSRRDRAPQDRGQGNRSQ